MTDKSRSTGGEAYKRGMLKKKWWNEHFLRLNHGCRPSENEANKKEKQEPEKLHARKDCEKRTQWWVKHVKEKRTRSGWSEEHCKAYKNRIKLGGKQARKRGWNERVKHARIECQGKMVKQQRRNANSGGIKARSMQKRNISSGWQERWIM